MVSRLAEITKGSTRPALIESGDGNKPDPDAPPDLKNTGVTQKDTREDKKADKSPSPKAISANPVDAKMVEAGIEPGSSIKMIPIFPEKKSQQNPSSQLTPEQAHNRTLQGIKKHGLKKEIPY